LALGDFAIHDPVSDYLLLLQSKNTALQDSKKLAQRLSAKQESLKLTNQELQREISERIRIEGELEQARDRALETSRLKSEFLATMSHEIRTPMNGIIGMTELLLESHLTQEQREYAEVVLHEAEHLLGIINDILDFSKIEAGKVILDEQTFSLLKLVDSVIELLTPQAEAKRLALIPFVAPEAPILVRGDPGRLRQILLNLVANAIKFTTHGEVYVRLEPIGQDAGLVTLRVTIIDTGIGISPEAQRLLFQPFTQVDGGTTRKHGGTGLGLAIAQRLVRLMQGEIGVQSCPGAGSTFWFTVVLGNATEPAQAPHPPLAPLLGMRALVVDGNATWRTVLQHYLTHWGMQVASASRGAEALLMLMEAATLGQPYTLALIDQALPGMDGRALGQAIQYEPTLASTQRILLTAFHDKGGDAAALGYAACLAKPLHYERLLTTVSQVIVRAGQEA
jgi:signal transduction histidine kinase/CheY-like chemotaxis protein